MNKHTETQEQSNIQEVASWEVASWEVALPLRRPPRRSRCPPPRETRGVLLQKGPREAESRLPGMTPAPVTGTGDLYDPLVSLFLGRVAYRIFRIILVLGVTGWVLYTFQP